jgi:hypothetical protein
MKDITLKNVPLAECVISIAAILIAACAPLATVDSRGLDSPDHHYRLVILSDSGQKVATLDARISAWTRGPGGIVRADPMKVYYGKIRLTPYGVTIPNRILLSVALAYALIAIVKAASNIKALYFVSLLLLACSMSHWGYMTYHLSQAHRITLGIGSMFLLGAFVALIICSIIEFLQNKSRYKTTSRCHLNQPSE